MPSTHSKDAGRSHVNRKSNTAITSKPYICTACGVEGYQSTNHYGPCYPICYMLCQQAMPTKHIFDHKRAVFMLANKRKEPDQ